MFNYLLLDMPTATKQISRVYRATYYAKNYEHAYAHVYVRDWGTIFKQVKPGSPIRMAIDGKDFYGYIHQIKNYQDSGKDFTELGIIGASYVMHQASQKVYRNVTADQVIVEIAKKYGFSYKVTPHPRVYKQVAQAGMTDWELMVRLAKQCGYFLRADNTSIHFKPLMQDFADLAYETPTFRKADAGFKPENPLYSFHIVAGETLHHDGVEKGAVSVAGVDPRTGNYFKYTKQTRAKASREYTQQEFFDQHATHLVANDYQTAAYIAESEDNVTRFAYLAEVEVIGASKLHAGHPVYLDGIGDEYSGYWTILQIEHEVVEEHINMQRFTTRLLVGADSLGRVTYPGMPKRPPAKPIRKINPNVLNTKIIPKTILKRKGASIKPANDISLVTRINRGDTTSGLVISNTWRSTVGNLNPLIDRKIMSDAVRERLAKYVSQSF